VLCAEANLSLTGRRSPAWLSEKSISRSQDSRKNVTMRNDPTRIVGYDVRGITRVTWGALQQRTWAFWKPIARRLTPS
jgi:hypothetical protein